MNLDDVIGWFGNLNKTCMALELASQNMTKWKRQGYIPWKQQFKIAVITEGALMPDDLDPYLVLNPKPPRKPRNRKPTRKDAHVKSDESSSSCSIGNQSGSL